MRLPSEVPYPAKCWRRPAPARVGRIVALEAAHLSAAIAAPDRDLRRRLPQCVPSGRRGRYPTSGRTSSADGGGVLPWLPMPPCACPPQPDPTKPPSPAARGKSAIAVITSRAKRTGMPDGLSSGDLLQLVELRIVEPEHGTCAPPADDLWPWDRHSTYAANLGKLGNLFHQAHRRQQRA